MSNADLLIIGPVEASSLARLESKFNVHACEDAQIQGLEQIAPGIRAIAAMEMKERISSAFMQEFPRLEIVASFGVGYDHVDAQWAGAHGILVTNTPDVLTEEVADTALGLLICTARELPQAMEYLKAGKWNEAPYPLTVATLRDRTVGLVGMGRIGQAIARRLDAFGVPTVYHARHRNATVPYRHYADLLQMAREVDTLLVIVPGGSATKHLIDAAVLEALGARGILINVARGSVVDQQALIEALAERRILAAGLDVFADEPHVPEALMRMSQVVLLPHVGSASMHTRGLMERLVIDNLLSFASGSGPLTPVAETRSVRRGGT